MFSEQTMEVGPQRICRLVAVVEIIILVPAHYLLSSHKGQRCLRKAVLKSSYILWIWRTTESEYIYVLLQN